MAFHIGQKVICWRVYGSPPVKGPAVGDVVTVRRFGLGLNLVKGVVEQGVGFDEFPYLWDPACFRPATERKTDISIFTAMLTPSPVTVDALNMADHARELVQ